jgi:transposase
LLAELAHKAGLEVFVINVRDLRRYAEGVGRRGKTDRWIFPTSRLNRVT